MSNGTSVPEYEPFACGRRCHPDRYTVFATRTWWGSKRWGVRDNHMGIKLTRLRPSFETAESWRISLAMMELQERRYGP
ncbi:hypothetical protein [Streptomyces sp. NBC_01238]|uniref:hypothetical protein n=1 Tax=Streptomyces sp. NBC_01238 TaxID=2903791 RepID=UPI002F913D18